MIAFGSEGHDGSGGAGLVDEVEGGAEKAGQGIGEGQPFVTRPDMFVTTLNKQSWREGMDILVVRLGVQPGPELNTRPAFFGAIPRPRSPALGIPSAQREPQVQLFGADML